MLNKKKRFALAAAAGTVVMLTMTGCSAADVLGITQAQAALAAVAHEQEPAAEQKPSAEPTAEETAEQAQSEAAATEAAPEPTPAAQATENALVALQAPSGDLASGSV